MHLRDTAGTILRIGIGSLFVAAGLLKGVSLSAFSDEIARYELLPQATVSIVAVVLIGLELACGFALIVNKGTRRSALVLSVLVVLFMTALGSRIARGIAGECGCFGDAVADPVGPGALIRDGILLCMTVAVAIRGKNH